MAFQAMSDNAEYSIDVALAVLKAKLARTEEVYQLSKSAGAYFSITTLSFSRSKTTTGQIQKLNTRKQLWPVRRV